MVRLVVPLVLAAGCSFQHGSMPAQGDAPPVGDVGVVSDGSAAPDAFVAPPDAQQCWTVAGVNQTICLTAPLSGNTTVSATAAIDTNATGTGATQCRELAPGSANVCAIAAQTITIDAGGGIITATGARPLVLIASSITVNGTIDVASHIGGTAGPSSDGAGCDPGNDATNGGGGQGGSFGGKGGSGGDQDGQNNSGGKAGNAMTPTTLRGGCPGRSGGGNGNSSGLGGGAVMLVADMLTLGAAGVINASGASGQGAGAGRNGGGGAGSGGMIALAGTTITLTSGGQLFANGGHGGGGSSNGTGGADGTDPTSPPSGGGDGTAGGNAGNGGVGYPASSRNGANASASGDGGGGAGGGAGIVHIYATTLNPGSAVSPPAT